jgi:hypothetical protein
MACRAEAEDHAYLAATDLPAPATAAALHAPGAAGTHMLLPLPDALILPGERAALAVPAALLHPQQRATTLCVLGQQAPGALQLIGTLVLVTSARAQDAQRGVRLCTCLGLCRGRVAAVQRLPGGGGLLQASTLVLDGLEAGARLPREAACGASHLPRALWRCLDAERAAARVRAQWAAAGLRALPLPPACPPPVLAWFVLRALPSLDEGARRALLACGSVSEVLRREASALAALAARGGRVALDCACGAAVVRDEAAALASPFGGAAGGAAGAAAAATSGPPAAASSHVFVNPAGHSFRIFTARAVLPGAVQVHGPPTLAHTWFAGFAWEIAECAACGEHLGWRYSRPNGGGGGGGGGGGAFWGLRVESVSMRADAEAGGGAAADAEGAE